jgi:hypothetical protein
MADIEWHSLPPLWPRPAVWTDVGELMLLLFMHCSPPPDPR